MKNICKLFIVGLVGMNAACADIDLSPLSEGSSENWYRDATEIEMSLNDLLRPDFYPIDSWQWDDDVERRDNPATMVAGTVTSKTGDVVSRWTALYKGISRAIKIVEALESGTATGVSNDKLNQYLGEAYFYMGFAHATLATYWGDAVINKNGMSLEDAYTATRSPKAEVLAWAYECFDKAIELLPDAMSAQMRPTKSSAYGFVARFALFHEDWQKAADYAKKCMDMGIYELHPDYGDLFVADKSPELMFYFKGDKTYNGGVGYGIAANVMAFTPRQYGAYCNSGPSFSLYCAYPCTDGLPIDESPLYNPKDGWANRDPRFYEVIAPQVTKYSEKFAAYEVARTDGTIAEKFPEHILMRHECNQNPYATTVYEPATGKMVANQDSRAVNAHAIYSILILKKYVKEDWADYKLYNSKGDNIAPYMRYAEVLMTYAEAMNEMGKCDQAVLDATVNKIRERAYANSGLSYPRAEAGSKEALRSLIRIERRIEFPFEALRYRDLLRWRMAEKNLSEDVYVAMEASQNAPAGWDGQSTDNLSAAFKRILKMWDDGNWPLRGTPDIDENGTANLKPQTEIIDGHQQLLIRKNRLFEAHNYLWPIPADDILVNPNLTQNPGY
ncbi:MAG: RagB/SusD family nutrient uptake outer membrane protein [Parabacteroides sp.]|nr:RagB/SusD family nutrient uptake outer membrane protein [Parabacteroides sp.]